MTIQTSPIADGRNLSDLSARELVAAIDAGHVSEDVVRDTFLDRCRQRQPQVEAWAHLDMGDGGDEPVRREKGLPLRGVPIAVKDLFDTADMPTAYGSDLYQGHRPAADAACVAMARAAGAIVLGKAATVEFGATRPCRTRNPYNLAHTPGGSSSGSAAAVADGQALLAVGSQTGGSIIRPAAFCGVVGFKPSFGALSTAGVRGFSWSLDTVGVFARDVPDAELFYRVLRGGPRPAFVPTAPTVRQLRFALFRSPFDSLAATFLHHRLSEIERRLADAGATVENLESPPAFTHALDWQRIISRYEMGRSLAFEWHMRNEALSTELRSEIAEGMAVSPTRYDLAKSEGIRLAREMAQQFSRFDAVITLATPGEAPLGLASTGDATFNRPWSLLGFPAISLPAGFGPLGLPVAVQLIGAPHTDDQLLGAARRLEQLIAGSPPSNDNGRVNLV